VIYEISSHCSELAFRTMKIRIQAADRRNSVGISVYFLRRSNNSGKYPAQLQHGAKMIEIT
jgi:hypothetical protein